MDVIIDTHIIFWGSDVSNILTYMCVCARVCVCVLYFPVYYGTKWFVLSLTCFVIVFPIRN